ncbi:amidase [Pseudoalteromonas luteoviolacea B = ATCC 29581]|nr:amidase [Pseudoalteromonas luteoviolacea B = ATCC 29581]
MRNCSWLINILLLLSGVLSLQSNAKDPLEGLTITAMQEMRSSNQITYQALTQHYIDRIKKLDDHYKSVITLAPDAIKQAKEKDLIFAKGNATGMLFGVPVLIKDNIDVKGLPTTAGAMALSKNVAKTDASIVAKLRKEGAIILGKTNLSEWANFKSMQSSSGYSKIGGQTKNAFHAQYSPCGSSSGSAVAVAVDFALVAIGTETDGSILCPASMNGLVGFKPSRHKISQHGIVPLAKSQDTAGPMTRNVEDAALVYSAITDDISPLINASVDYSSLSIGLIGHMQQFYIEHLTALVEVLDQFAVKGTSIHNHLPFAQVDALINAEMQILLFEFQRDVNVYLKERGPANVKSLNQLIEFNRAQGDNKQDLLESAAKFQDQEKFNLAKLVIQEFALSQLKKLKEKHNIDVFVAPSTGEGWKIDPINGDKYTGGSSWLAAMIGAPAITVPLQVIDGIPSGLTFFALPGEDLKVLTIAREFEKMQRKN